MSAPQTKSQQMLRSHNQTIFETLGRHPIHPFPARMAPGIALEALGQGKTPLRVLDPMAGSGTVLAVARANGHRAYGVDSDPLAVLLSSVWTHSIDAEYIKEKATTVLERARHRFATLSSGRAYPKDSDDETRSFLRYWFDDYARRQLTSLSSAISAVRDRSTRDVLWCAFSRLIITKSSGASRAMDLSHSRPHRAFEWAPEKPFNGFISAVKTVAANCPNAKNGQVGPAAIVKCGDARELDLSSNSIDLVLTSPPYLNAIDYLRCSKFSLVWMGYSIAALRDIRGESIGASAASEASKDVEWIKRVVLQLRLKPALSNRNCAILSRYIWDMGRALREVARVLRVGGRAVYVVGDSTIRGTFVRNSAIVAEMAVQNGLSLQSRHCRSLPANRRYLPPPKHKVAVAALDARMGREVVLVFKKSAA